MIKGTLWFLWIVKGKTATTALAARAANEKKPTFATDDDNNDDDGFDDNNNGPGSRFHTLTHNSNHCNWKH